MCHIRHRDTGVACTGYLRCTERASCIKRVYIGGEMGDGAVPKQAAAAGEVIVRGCPQQVPVAPKHLIGCANQPQCIWPSRPRQHMLPRLRKDRNKSRVHPRGQRTNQPKKQKDITSGHYEPTTKGVCMCMSCFTCACTRSCSCGTKKAKPHLACVRKML